MGSQKKCQIPLELLTAMKKILIHKKVLLFNSMMIILALGFIFPHYTQDLITLDMLFQGYNTSEAIRVLESFGVQGRLNYFFVSRYLDSVMPLIYTSLLLGLILRLSSNPNAGFNSKLYQNTLIIFSLSSALFDYAENYLICQILVSYPHVSVQDIEWASMFTISKWLCLVMTTAGIATLALL